MIITGVKHLLLWLRFVRVDRKDLSLSVIHRFDRNLDLVGLRF